MNTSDLRIKSLDKSPKGGQTVGMPSLEILVTHLPTGLTATCGCERSQMKNKNVALSMIEYGLAEIGWNDNIYDKT